MVVANTAENNAKVGALKKNARYFLGGQIRVSSISIRMPFAYKYAHY